MVVGALALLNLVKHNRPAGEVSVSVAAAAGLVAFARRSGLDWEQLGLGKESLRAGAPMAGGAVATVATAYLGGVLLPATRTAFLDTRYQVAPREAMGMAFLAIPLGTVLLEEVAFRSVLWGMLGRHATAPGVVLASSSLFGLWHVLPSLHFASVRSSGLEAPSASVSGRLTVVLGTVAFTTLGGVVAGELRRRSGSLLPSAGMHWATNGLGVLFGLAAWRLERSRGRDRLGTDPSQAGARASAGSHSSTRAHLAGASLAR